MKRNTKVTTLPKLFIILFSRMGLALGLQVIVALIYLISGSADSWRLGADWWVVGLTIANIIGIVLLSYSLKKEGKRLRDIWAFSKDKQEKKKDITWFILALVVSIPLAMIPNILIGNLLWGSAQIGADMSFRALPLWAAIALLLVFPITQGLTELTLYFGYVMPRLGKYMKGSLWWPLVVCSAVLALQHVFLPLLFDWKFILWRALMFLPFAFWVGFIIKRRFRALPYMMVLHGFIDMSIPIMILIASL